MTSETTIIIPTIPGREDLLARAMDSVHAQTLQPDIIIVEHDLFHEGAAITRNRALADVTTIYTAFLDDDDTINPNHLEVLHAAIVEHDVDLVYPWFDVVSTRHEPGFDPLGWFGKDFDPVALRQANFIPITVLAKTDAIQKVGGFEVPPWYSGSGPVCEDWYTWIKLTDAGYTIKHVPVRTWKWHWHDSNTGGKVDM